MSTRLNNWLPLNLKYCHETVPAMLNESFNPRQAESLDKAQRKWSFPSRLQNRQAKPKVPFLRMDAAIFEAGLGSYRPLSFSEFYIDLDHDLDPGLKKDTVSHSEAMCHRYDAHPLPWKKRKRQMSSSEYLCTF